MLIEAIFNSKIKKFIISVINICTRGFKWWPKNTQCILGQLNPWAYTSLKMKINENKWSHKRVFFVNFDRCVLFTFYLNSPLESAMRWLWSSIFWYLFINSVKLRVGQLKYTYFKNRNMAFIPLQSSPRWISSALNNNNNSSSDRASNENMKSF